MGRTYKPRRREFDDDIDYDGDDPLRIRSSSRGRGGLGLRRGSSYFGGKSRGRGGYGLTRNKSYISDDDLHAGYDDYANFKYPNVIFHVTKHNKEERNNDEAVPNTITHNFLKEFLVEPLMASAPKAPQVFTVLFRNRKRSDNCSECRCGLHSQYISFLKRKEEERIEAEKKRKQEILTRQEDHAFILRLQRERDRMLAL